MDQAEAMVTAAKACLKQHIKEGADQDAINVVLQELLVNTARRTWKAAAQYCRDAGFDDVAQDLDKKASSLE